MSRLELFLLGGCWSSIYCLHQMAISSPGVCSRQLRSLSSQLCSAQVLCQPILSKGSAPVVRAPTGAQGPGYSIPFFWAFCYGFSFLFWLPSPPLQFIWWAPHVCLLLCSFFSPLADVKWTHMSVSFPFWQLITETVVLQRGRLLSDRSSRPLIKLWWRIRVGTCMEKSRSPAERRHQDPTIPVGACPQQRLPRSHLLMGSTTSQENPTFHTTAFEGHS